MKGSRLAAMACLLGLFQQGCMTARLWESYDPKLVDRHPLVEAGVRTVTVISPDDWDGFTSVCLISLDRVQLTSEGASCWPWNGLVDPRAVLRLEVDPAELRPLDILLRESAACDPVRSAELDLTILEEGKNGSWLCRGRLFIETDTRAMSLRAFRSASVDSVASIPAAPGASCETPEGSVLLRRPPTSPSIGAWLFASTFTLMGDAALSPLYLVWSFVTLQSNQKMFVLTMPRL